MLNKHLHIKIDERTHAWIKKQAHKYKKSIGEMTRSILEVEMIAQKSYEKNKKEHLK